MRIVVYWSWHVVELLLVVLLLLLLGVEVVVVLSLTVVHVLVLTGRCLLGVGVRAATEVMAPWGSSAAPDRGPCVLLLERLPAGRLLLISILLLVKLLGMHGGGVGCTELLVTLTAKTKLKKFC